MKHSLFAVDWLHATTLWPSLLMVAAMCWAGLIAAPSDRAPAVVVGMTNQMEYTPDTVRIQQGETVRWKNSSAVMHTVTADPEKAFKDKSVQLPDEASTFHSGNLDPKDTYEHTFSVPGTYRYFCVPHEATGMYGTVIVESAGT